MPTTPRAPNTLRVAAGHRATSFFTVAGAFMMPRPRSREHFALFALFTLSSGALPACAVAPESVSTTALRLSFPDHVAEVLEAPLAFASTDRGFARITPERGSILRAELPRRGDSPILLAGPEGFSIQVREVSAKGEGSLVGSAVAYRRAGGTSYWTAATTGVEEWLHLDAGQATRGQAVAAWAIEGASLVQSGDAIALRDKAGVTRILVTAPVAYAASGRKVEARLSVHGAQIELTVDAGGEAVLVDPLWTSVASLPDKRVNHTMTLLADGEVLITGGTNFAAVGTTDQGVATTALRDPVTGTWAAGASMIGPRLGHTATLLGGGHVLVTGGTISGNETGVLASAEVYNPATHTWAATPPLTVARYGHEAIAVGSGNTKVLVFGGQDITGAVLASAELYDSASNTWSAVPPMATARLIPTAVRLADGRVLVAGGKAASLSSIAAAEIYDPATNAWSPTAPMHFSRYWHSALLLGNGKVLVAAGNTQSDPVMSSFVKISEIYDPLAGTWADKAPLGVERDRHSAGLLENGGVLVVGGDTPPGTSAELYDPGTDAWVPAGKLAVTDRFFETMVRLDDGSMLVAGGVSATDPLLCELYTSGAAGAPCTVAVECQSGSCVSGACAAIPGSTTGASSSSGAGGGGATTGGAGGSGGDDAATSSGVGAGGGASALGSKSDLSTCSVDGLPGRTASSSAPWIALGLILALRRRKPATA
jgi:Kelch motif protein